MSKLSFNKNIKTDKKIEKMIHKIKIKEISLFTFLHDLVLLEVIYPILNEPLF